LEIVRRSGQKTVTVSLTPEQYSEFVAKAEDKYNKETGALDIEPGFEARVRIENDEGTVTLKGPKSKDGAKRVELQGPVDRDVAKQLLSSDVIVGRVIDKTRITIELDGGARAEVDVYHGEAAERVRSLGIDPPMIAEVEYESEERRTAFLDHKPEWLGEKVTGRKELGNAQLATAGISSAQTLD
jgi:CYTH domain-containing protein